MNTLVYEVGNRGPEESLRSAAKFGFKYIEYAGIRKGNPATMTSEQKKEALRIVKDNGLVSSQMLHGGHQRYSPSRSEKAGCSI